MKIPSSSTRGPENSDKRPHGRLQRSGGNETRIADELDRLDLALALIVKDLGLEAARTVAPRLVLYHRRAGGQSQFSSLLAVVGVFHQRACRLQAEVFDRLRRRLAGFGLEGATELAW